MTRTEQNAINTEAMNLYDEAMNEYKTSAKSRGRLRTCSAYVLETENYFILRSYNTIIAVIDKRTDTLADVLRVVYGYTATSSQHISKFEKDYCSGKWNCKRRLTAR